MSEHDGKTGPPRAQVTGANVPSLDATGSDMTGSHVIGPDDLPPLRDVISALNLWPKKNLGQNFILDLNLTRRIANAGGALSGTTVLEIGPGPGGLTRALLMEGAERVIAIERDDRCQPALEQISQAWPGQLSIVMGDALGANWLDLLVGTTGRVMIVANLPYGIATKLLVGWLETHPWPPWFDRMVLMFQREVADRIVAEPGTKAYGRLAVLAQWRCECWRALTLKPEAFTPPPKVSSAVVVLRPRPLPTPACRVETLGRVTAAAFGQRRKMLRASLKQITPMPELLLDRAGLRHQARAEELSVSEFATLAGILDGPASTA